MHVLANFEFNVTIKIYLLTFMQQDKRQNKKQKKTKPNFGQKKKIIQKDLAFAHAPLHCS